MSARQVWLLTCDDCGDVTEKPVPADWPFAAAWRVAVAEHGWRVRTGDDHVCRKCWPDLGGECPRHGGPAAKCPNPSDHRRCPDLRPPWWWCGDCEQVGGWRTEACDDCREIYAAGPAHAGGD